MPLENKRHSTTRKPIWDSNNQNNIKSALSTLKIHQDIPKYQQITPSIPAQDYHSHTKIDQKIKKITKALINKINGSHPAKLPIANQTQKKRSINFYFKKNAHIGPLHKKAVESIVLSRITLFL